MGKIKIKSIDELREILSDEIDKIRSGKVSPQRANSLINACGKILASVRLEIEFAKYTGKPIKSNYLIEAENK